MRAPIVVRLTLPLLRRGDLALARAAGARRGDVAAVRRALACSGPERRFARALLERRTHLWLLRADQRAFAGDFVVVDLSPPRLERRAALVLELKQGASLVRAGSTRHQVQHAAAVVAAAARATGALAPAAPFEVLVGDPTALLAWLGAGDALATRAARPTIPG
ncbi:MAG: hypothetical protein M9894_02800 [Planctomycetes bacterium]|nr:hypothetical protein [Planctomycetota bacterium]